MATAKSDTTTLTAAKNIPISLFGSEGKIPDKLRRHPGGARVERGTKITVSKGLGAKLKAIGYAKAAVILLLALSARPALAQTDTTNVSVTTYDQATACVYTASIDHSSVDSTATYETQSMFIGDANSDTLRVFVVPSADTVAVTFDYTNDLTNYQTVSPATADSITAATWFELAPDQFAGNRYVSIEAGWTNGTVGTTRLEVFVRKRDGAQPGRCNATNR